MKLERLFDPATPAEISAFEAGYQVSLPVSYREFLQRWNGGQPKPNSFEIPDIHQSALIDLLYGIGPHGAPADLATEFDLIQNELPEGFLPIGHDPGGNYILLGVLGSQIGKLFYWDVTRFFDQSDESGDVYQLSESFGEFLLSLSS